MSDPQFCELSQVYLTPRTPSMLWLEIQPLAESSVPLETGNHLDSVAGVLFPVDLVPMQQGLLMH